MAVEGKRPVPPQGNGWTPHTPQGCKRGGGVHNGALPARKGTAGRPPGRNVRRERRRTGVRRGMLMMRSPPTADAPTPTPTATRTLTPTRTPTHSHTHTRAHALRARRHPSTQRDDATHPRQGKRPKGNIPAPSQTPEVSPSWLRADAQRDHGHPSLYMRSGRTAAICTLVQMTPTAELTPPN